MKQLRCCLKCGILASTRFYIILFPKTDPRCVKITEHERRNVGHPVRYIKWARALHVLLFLVKFFYFNEIKKLGTSLLFLGRNYMYASLLLKKKKVTIWH